MVNNRELYNIVKDPGQKTNVIKQHPEVVRTIQDAHKAYWERVSPGDRDKPRFIVGHPKDPETFLAWDAKSGKDKLIYGHRMKALPVESIQLEVGGFSGVQQVNPKGKQAVFDIPLKQGATQVKGTMLDPQGKTIAGAYYIYVKRLLPENAQESNKATGTHRK